jgi:type I restriction enzyme S subunit
MSFPRYPKYKASGVEWLGEVPEGWEVKPLRNVFKFSKGLTITKEDLRDDGICCVNYGEIHSKYGFRLNPDIHPLRCVEPRYLNTHPEALIRDGDFVFADTSEDLEGSGNFTHLRSENPIFAGYHTIIGRPRKGVSPLLLAYQIHSPAFRSQIRRQVKGVKVFSISQGILKGVQCLIPPLSEQRAIASFLDRETAKLDGLVAEQRRLIALLKEKRQAVISHAVTKGLHPNAPTKPSGIPWLGDVPAHWEIKRIKRLITILTDYTANGSFASLAENVSYLPAGPSRLVRLTDLREDLKNEGLYVGDDAHEFLAKSELFGGEVLVANVGAYAGYACLMPSGKGKATLGPNMYLIRFRSETISNEYGLLCLMSICVQEQLKIASTSTAQPKLNKDDVKDCVTVIPPTLEEQAELLSYIKTRSLEFDALTAEAQRSIDLLQERRTALISAAVTGQIDVRQSPL